jgi:NADPH2:quinone reductase
MVKAIRIHEHGGPEVLKWEEVEVPDPKEGEIRLKQKAIGLNYLDVYKRQNLRNLAPPLPYTPGMEGAGVVTAVGPGVTTCKVGDAVAYASLQEGAYAEERILPADLAVAVPSSIDPVVAAAVIFKGLTTHVLINKGFKVERGHTILVHAAAGGVGSLLCQWASAKGATVIGTVSTQEKAVQAKEDGCHHVILYKDENFVDRVMEITSGKGVDVVYDSVGKDTLNGSLECLNYSGCLVSFGIASGVPEPVRYDQLVSKSLVLSSIGYYTDVDRDALQVAAKELFADVEKGVLRVRVNHKFPLSQASQAHAAIESRKTTGSIVLIPDDE